MVQMKRCICSDHLSELPYKYNEAFNAKLEMADATPPALLRKTKGEGLRESVFVIRLLHLMCDCGPEPGCLHLRLRPPLAPPKSGVLWRPRAVHQLQRSDSYCSLAACCTLCAAPIAKNSRVTHYFPPLFPHCVPVQRVLCCVLMRAAAILAWSRRKQNWPQFYK